MMRPVALKRSILLATVAITSTAAPALIAQESTSPQPSGRFAAIDELDAKYQKQYHDLESRQLADLAALAEGSSGAQADVAFERLFRLAIARKLCPRAQASAERCLNSGKFSRDVRSLATLVQVMARVDKGEVEQAVADMKRLFQTKFSDGSVGPMVDADFALTVGEGLLERLIHDGRYDVARKLCDFACEGDGPAIIEDHFKNRMARLELIGEPGPAIAGLDVDGKPVSLGDLKGHVVMIDFWATWCPPCVASVPTLSALVQKYHDRGFAILGVNVDAMGEDVMDPKKALQTVRRFLVKQRVSWINVMNGTGSNDFAAAYKVEHIPANVLIGRDGAVIAMDQHGEALERVIETALRPNNEHAPTKD